MRLRAQGAAPGHAGEDLGRLGRPPGGGVVDAAAPLEDEGECGEGEGEGGEEEEEAGGEGGGGAASGGAGGQVVVGRRRRPAGAVQPRHCRRRGKVANEAFVAGFGECRRIGDTYRCVGNVLSGGGESVVSQL